MSPDELYSPLVIRNSPIEFVISGPIGGRDRVLVRTEKAGLDLIALSAKSIEFEYLAGPTRNSIFEMLGLAGLGANAVSSMPVPDFFRDKDARRSNLGFAWAGQSTKRENRHIEEVFNYAVPDLLLAIEERNPEHAEYSLAPLVLRCSQINSERKRRALVVRLFAISYVVLLAVVGAGVTISDMFKR